MLDLIESYEQPRLFFFMLFFKLYFFRGWFRRFIKKVPNL